MNLCKYKDIFGIPNQGIHSYRFMNLAIADVILTLIASYIISIIFNTNFVITTVLLFISGIILHRIFCVKTTIDKLIFKN
jgi:hypothetical protein